MAVATLLSIEEFEALKPPEDFRYELDAGELVKVTFPTPWHNLTLKAVVKILDAFVEDRKLGLVFPSDTGYILAREPATMRGPDVSFVRRERAAELDLRRNVPHAPDLAVEIVSPSDTIRDMRRKVAQFLAAGTVAVWVLDTDLRQVEVYRQGDERPTVLVAGETLECPELLPGFSVRVDELFPNEG